MDLMIWAMASSVLREGSVASHVQDERAAALTREDVVVEARACAAQVQVAGGRGREADADSFAHGGYPYPATAKAPVRRAVAWRYR